MKLCLSLLLVLCFTACTNGGGSTAGQPRLFGSRYPYGKRVPGVKGMVYSPYSDNGAHIDVRGYARGTEVTDPWSGQKFLVP